MPVTGSDAAERPAFLRWLVFVVAAICPAFTCGDLPSRFITEAEVPAFGARPDAERRAHRGGYGGRGGPWLSGARMPAIDVHVIMMAHWKPEEDWFRAEAPRIMELPVMAPDLPVFRPATERNSG